MNMAPKAPIEPTLCPLCTFSSKRLTAFEQHLRDVHNTTSQALWNQLHGGPGTCRCGCGQPTTWLGWKAGYSTMLCGHNGNIYAVHDGDKAREIAQKRRDKLVGRESWSKGLTKETDDRVAVRAEATATGRKKAFDEGRLTMWSKGLTKETDDRVAAMADQQRQRFATGETTPWALGLTKETDDRVAAMATKVSMIHKQRSLRSRLDDLKRLKREEIVSRIEHNSTLEVVGDLLDYQSDAVPNIRVRCRTCSQEWFDSLRKLQHGRCYQCDPGGSKAQAEVARYIESLGVTVQRNVRTVIMGVHRNAELDVYVPDHKLAIEYNGLYWHNEHHKSREYHQNKTNCCAELGISLFHLFEDEWRDKQAVVTSMIRHRLGLTPTTAAARKCAVVELTVKERRRFFEENHIDGDTNAKVAFGLVADGDVVAAMSLRTPFHKKHRASLEVARFCTRLNTSVVGGLSRLTVTAQKKTREEGFETLLSYVDTRLGARGGWAAAGWTKVSSTPARFWWTDDRRRFNRFKFKADKARGMSEADVAKEAGVAKIWGCGNDVYEFKTDE